jgi:hypothetical protein
MSSNKQIILYGMCVVSLALQLSAICTKNWGVGNMVDIDDPQQKVPNDIGLWEMCMQSRKTTGDVTVDNCLHIPPPDQDMKSFPKNSLYTVRAFSIMSVVLVFLSTICMMSYEKYKKCQLTLLSSAAISSVIATIVWGVEFTKNMQVDKTLSVKYKLGYSYFLYLSGAIISCITAMYYYYV